MPNREGAVGASLWLEGCADIATFAFGGLTMSIAFRLTRIWVRQVANEAFRCLGADRYRFAAENSENS
jgi:hypothetical protein